MRKLIASGTSGGIATASDVATLVLLVRNGMPVAPAAFLSCAVGAVVCFTLNKYIAFRDRSRITWQQLGRFGVVAVATALFMALAMQIVAVKLAVPYLIAKLICSVVIFVVWSYPAMQRGVFHDRSLDHHSRV